MNWQKSRALILILLIGLLIRIVVSIYSYHIDVMKDFADNLAYYQLAEGILQQGPFIMDLDALSPTARVVGPAIGWIMALIMMIFGSSWLPIFIFNSILGTAICYVLYLLGREVGNEKVGLMAAAWSAIYYFFIHYVPTAGKEVWITLLLLSLTYLLIRLSTSARKWRIIIAMALLYGFFIHIDERYCAYFPILFGGILLMDSSVFKQRIYKALVFSLLLGLLMVPWLIRNYQVYHRVIIISTRTAPITDKIFGYHIDKYYAPDEARWKLSDAQIDSIMAGHTVYFAQNKKVRPDQMASIRRGIRPHQFSFTESLVSRFVELWAPVDFHEGYKRDGFQWDGKWSLPHNAISFFLFGMLLPFFFYGWYLLFRHKQHAAWLLTAVLLLHTLIHMLFIPYTLDRYRFPVDGLVMVLAFYGLWYIRQSWLLKKTA